MQVQIRQCPKIRVIQVFGVGRKNSEKEIYLQYNYWSPGTKLKVSNRFDFTESEIEMNQFHAPNTFLKYLSIQSAGTIHQIGTNRMHNEAKVFFTKVTFCDLKS